MYYRKGIGIYVSKPTNRVFNNKMKTPWRPSTQPGHWGHPLVAILLHSSAKCGWWYSECTDFNFIRLIEIIEHSYTHLSAWYTYTRPCIETHMHCHRLQLLYPLKNRSGWLLNCVCVCVLVYVDRSYRIVQSVPTGIESPLLGGRRVQPSHFVSYNLEVESWAFSKFQSITEHLNCNSKLLALQSSLPRLGW